ncbi:MAG TPA: C25 family cysteine peptidase, partial [Chitinophagaceae bacterium]|nr:C25 family cysteine peptidase [Chitinophagaceae bacterium]
VNSATPNLRFISTLNDVGNNTLPKEPFFIHTAAKYWRDRIGLGNAEVVGENIYSSAYDKGEGWASDDIRNRRTLTEVMSNLKVYTGPGAPTQANFRIHASGYNRENQRVFRVTINNDSILGQQMDFFEYVKVNKPFPVSLIASGTASISITNQTTVVEPDRMVVAQVEISYPRQFDFGNASNFMFTLPASTPGNYLEISNFNYGSTAPVLYDFTNGKRYVADISNPLLIKFALQPSATERKLLLVSEDPSAIINVNSLQQRNFVNYGLASNQGDYLIITHSSILNGAGGSQPVEDYKAYRSSPAGGGFNTRVYLIEELIDQFALGIKMHPLSVRNFLRWARNTYSSPIKNVFLIGKGVEYTQYRDYESSPNIEKLAFIPTFGHPASDVLLAAEPGLDEIPRTPIGRLSVIKGDEITIYLQKVIQYEQMQITPSPLIRDKAWMKNVAHVIGAGDDNLATILTNSMDGFKRIIIDTFYGARVSTFSKTSSQSVEQANSTQLKNLFQEGLGIATYFGHSSASTLEFNLDNPENYNNPGKYPLFILLGCNAGNFFNYNEQRLEVMETISEKFIFSPGKGSIATIASTHLGVVHYLDVYNRKNYISLGNTKYGKGLGESMIETVTQVYNQLSQNNFYARCHNEQSTLHGDPAIKLYNFPKPDYVIEDQLVRINPGFISLAEPNFKVDAKFMNIGAAINKNIVVELKRTYPNNTTIVFQRDTIPGIRYIDSIQYVINIDPTTDKGLNKITITVEADNVVDELFETNNTITKEIYI